MNTEKALEILKEVHEALEKQIPKEVKTNAREQFVFEKVGHCPGCGEKVRGNMKYCDYCGQRLLWKV